MRGRRGATFRRSGVGVGPQNFLKKYAKFCFLVDCVIVSIE